MEVIGIIATKNRVELLKLAVNSVLKQTDKIDKLYIVSDSDDENFILEKELLKEVDCILLRDKYTHNYAGNLNTAIDHILINKQNLSGIYIAFLDDDDYWDENYLAICKAHACNKDFVVTGLRCDMDNHKYDLEIPKYLNVHDFLKGNPGIQGSNTFIKLETLLKAGCFDEKLSSTTDRDLFTRVMLIKPTYEIINDYLVYVNSSNKRPRITNSSEIKKDGLSRFYLKHISMMDKDDEALFLKRANERFGLRKEELDKRIKLIEKENNDESKQLKKYNQYISSLFTCNQDILFLLNLCPGLKTIDTNLVNLIKNALVQLNNGSEKLLAKTLALVSCERYINDFKYKRNDIYNKYSKIADYIGAKYIRNRYLIGLNNNINSLFEDDEVEIKAVIDYVRHFLTTKDTLTKFLDNKSEILNLLKVNEFCELGYGSEGYVFKGDKYIYKWFKNWDLNLVSHLLYLKDKIMDCSSIYNFELAINGDHLFLKYPFVESEPIKDINKDELKHLIDDFKQQGLCLTNINKRNFIRDKNGLKYIDYGFSIRGFDNDVYQRSLLRANQLIENFNKSPLLFYKAINESYIKGEK